ncbi:helix-turn-helix transcriptional regulator [Nodosilinea sp. E11]|uniref:helix-turn-helix domain-containing protein n=1 Tax=Nodosilinea sp. E11 TaxID=3037479 RepID=UPI00293498A0|nr:helix-turn-helix transcriptional regulator [Nodosilinea sp. E11]WOD37102.1 helix-turn-helix transcriptional regulator [Nodosilinea sp. E11]
MASGIGVVSFRDALREVMAVHGAQASVVARSAGISESSLSKYLSGTFDLRTSDTDRIRQALTPAAHEHLLRLLGLPQLELLAADGQDRALLMESAIQDFVRQCSDRDYLRILGAVTRGRTEALGHST